jgi:hypothetical protein
MLFLLFVLGFALLFFLLRSTNENENEIESRENAHNAMARDGAPVGDHLISRIGTLVAESKHFVCLLVVVFHFPSIDKNGFCTFFFSLQKQRKEESKEFHSCCFSKLWGVKNHTQTKKTTTTKEDK